MKLDFRDEVFVSIHAHMRENPASVVVTNDMGAMGLDAIRAEFPSRAINVGIAEQNLLSVAAGMAQTGFRVFVFGIIAHVFGRSFEQFRNDICIQNLPVSVVAVGSGLAYGSDGPTHHGVQDIACLRTLPNITIYNPGDGVSARKLTAQAATLPGPSYVRMDKEQLEPVYGEDEAFDKGYAQLTAGTDGVLFTTGVMIHRALEVAAELAKDGKHLRVIDVYRLKPVDGPALARIIAEAPLVASLEENAPIGGLTSLLAETMALAGLARPFLPMTLADEEFLGAASRTWAEQRYGLDTASVVARLRRAMAGLPAGVAV